MNPTVTTEHLTLRFGDTTAVDDLTVSIAPGRITGLLGRNGAGKSTLMSILAGYLRPTSGRALVGGAEPFEDAERMAETVLAREQIFNADTTSVKEYFRIAAAVRPRWDDELAQALLDRFEIPHKKRIAKLSHGKRAAVSVAAGLACRAPLTLFDEPHLGMDAPSRYAFYDALLADYAANPRTIVLSTHIIDEISNVIEDVVIIDRGRLVVSDSVEHLRTRGAEVTGPAADVDEVTFGRRVLSTRSLGNTKSAIVHDDLGGSFARLAAELGVDVGPLPLQDLFVHLTEPPTRQPVEVPS